MTWKEVGACRGAEPPRHRSDAGTGSRGSLTSIPTDWYS
jgi:hypothetical protein